MVADGAFPNAFQLQFDLPTNEVRVMRHFCAGPRRELVAVPPCEFIPLAEATGVIVPLGRGVPEVGCQAATIWLDPCGVAVNVSPRQFVVAGFGRLLPKCCGGSDYEPICWSRRSPTPH